MAPPELDTKNFAEYGNVPFKAGVINTHEGGEDVFVSRTYIEDSPYTLQNAVIDFATAATHEIIAAPGAGKKLRIYKIVAVADFGVSTKLTYLSDAEPLSGAMQVDVISDDFIGGLYLDCFENDAFNLLSSSPGQVSGYVLYREMDV
jgi:hypothetical protein